MSGDGKIFNAENAQNKALEAVGNITKRVNDMRNSEGYKEAIEKRDKLGRQASAGVTSILDSTNMVGNKQQREEQIKNAREGMLNVFSGVKRKLGKGLQNLKEEGRQSREENKLVGGRKTKKSRRNKRKSTRKTRKNKRKTKKSKKSKRKSRKTRRK